MEHFRLPFQDVKKMSIPGVLAPDWLTWYFLKQPPHGVSVCLMLPKKKKKTPFSKNSFTLVFVSNC